MSSEQKTVRGNDRLRFQAQSLNSPPAFSFLPFPSAQWSRKPCVENSGAAYGRHLGPQRCKRTACQSEAPFFLDFEVVSQVSIAAWHTTPTFSELKQHFIILSLSFVDGLGSVGWFSLGGSWRVEVRWVGHFAFNSELIHCPDPLLATGKNVKNSVSRALFPGILIQRTGWD